MIVGRKCSKCAELKPLDRFYQIKQRKRVVWAARCKECRLAASRAYNKNNLKRNSATKTEWRRNNSEAVRGYELKRLYKITLEEYAAMTASGCNACGSMENLVIDHDHTCCPDKKTCGNCIRGVLCNDCNIAEGHLRGNPDRALALAAYMLKNTNYLENPISALSTERGIQNA